MNDTSDAMRELYQAIILDHNKHPRHYGVLADYSEKLEGYNPLCGDKIVFYVRREGGRIKAASFECAACAICKASASILLEQAMSEGFNHYQSLHNQALVLLDPAEPLQFDTGNDLNALAGVRAFPARLKCAKLAWETLMPN